MHKFTLVCLFSMILGLVACGSPPPVTSGLGAQAVHSGDGYSEHLKVDNPSLGRQLEITKIKSRQTNNLLEVNLELSSQYQKSLKLQYHFNWFDAQGFAVEPQKSPWHAIELHGMQSLTIRAVAPNSLVDSFNLYVREIPGKYYKY